MSHPRHPQRLMAILAVVGIAAGGALVLPSVAQADGPTWRPGGCKQKEGQTIVLDWIDPEDKPSTARSIVRCIPLKEGDLEYPVASGNKLEAPLASAGFDFVTTNSVITTIEGIPAGPDQYWFYVRGEVGNWTTDWEPEPLVDSFLGISLSPKKSPRNPVPAPQYDMPDPADEPTLKPTPTKSETATASPSATPSDSSTASASATASPSNSASSSATSSPTVTRTPPVTVQTPAPQTPTAPAPAPATTTATPTATASSTRRPSRTTRPNRPPRRTTRPQRPTNPPQPPMNPPAPPTPEPPPVQEPINAPTEDGSGQATGAPAVTPSRVWGREDATRQSSEASRTETPAPWSQLAAVAGAVVIVGGLGTAFARGLQTSTPPVVEEE